MKGVPKSIKLELQTYLNILLDEEHHEVEMRTLQMNKNKKMTRQHKLKKGLSDISVKVHVEDDRITCSGLKQNNKYL